MVRSKAPRRVLLSLSWALMGALLVVVGCPGPTISETQPPQPPKPGTRCRRTLAAFDIGSATTKMQVAEVDVCLHRIVRSLTRNTRPVPYGEDVAQHGAVQQATLDKGVAALQELVRQAAQHQPENLREPGPHGLEPAVATEALRRARNGAEVIAHIKRETSLQVTIIPQTREATLAFWGALMAEPSKPDDSIVWDVGGESMQLTALARDRVMIHGVDFATNDMRRYLAEQIQGKPANASPNPVSREQASAAREHARKQALGKQPTWLQTRLALGNAVVVGVGAIRYYTDKGSGKKRATRAGLEAALADSIGKTDADLGGPYAPVRIPALALILGGMDAMGVERLDVVDVDLTDGLLATYSR